MQPKHGIIFRWSRDLKSGFHESKDTKPLYQEYQPLEVETRNYRYVYLSILILKN